MADRLAKTCQPVGAMNTTTENTLTEERALVEAGAIIKLDLDVHATQTTVVQQVGGLLPKPAGLLRRSKV